MSMSTAVLFTETATRIQKPRPYQFFEEPVQCVETAWDLKVILDTQLTCSSHVSPEG
jgi:hypothetical protein